MLKILILISFFTLNFAQANTKCSLAELRNKLINQSNINIPKIDYKKEIKIAIVDTGINPFIGEIRKRIYVPNKYKTINAFGYNALNKSSFPYDMKSTGHGTHVAGIILALFPNAKIFPIKYYGGKQKEGVDYYLDALKVAVESDVEIINISGGGSNVSEEEKELIEQAKAKGQLVIVAAGNNRKNIDINKNEYYPASYKMDNLISVANVNFQNQLHATSNWGLNVDVSSFGTRVPSFGFNGLGCSHILTGTSQSTPFVTALAAMIMSAYPGLNIKEVKNIILTNTIKTIDLSGKIKTGIANFDISATMIEKTKSVESSESFFKTVLNLK